MQGGPWQRQEMSSRLSATTMGSVRISNRATGSVRLLLEQTPFQIGSTGLEGCVYPGVVTMVFLLNPGGSVRISNRATGSVRLLLEQTPLRRSLIGFSRGLGGIQATP